MVADRTLYDVLGVEPNATEDEIRSAYRKKSLDNHPDRGGSHEMMQKINAANEVLKDAKKRAMYDKYGLKGLQNQMGDDDSPLGGFSGGSLFDLFDIFNNGRRQPAAAARGQDIKHSLKVSLEEMYSGTRKMLNVDRNVVCVDCKGTGSSDGINHECRVCHGSGVETVIRRLGPMIQQMQGACSTCHGEGRTIDREKRCKTCHGRRVIETKKKLDITVPHGSFHEEVIRFIGDGHEIPNGEAGSIFIVLEQLPHTTFVRKDDDLSMTLQINLTESLCGFQRKITLLDKHEIVINHPSGKPIVPNSYRCLKGYGMPNRSTHSHGDLIIQFNVEFPPENFILSDEQLRALETNLPPKKEMKLTNKDRYEQVEMNEYHPSHKHSQKRSHGHHHNHDMHDDSEDAHGHHPRCHMQ